MKNIILILATFLLSACSTSSNLHVGNEMSYSSLKDQREANKTVRVYKALPKGAHIIDQVEASRCHRMANHSAPKKDVVIQDMKIAAYTKGADGITNIKITKEGDLISNCWYVLNGKATAFSLK